MKQVNLLYIVSATNVKLIFRCDGETYWPILIPRTASSPNRSWHTTLRPLARPAFGPSGNTICCLTIMGPIAYHPGRIFGCFPPDQTKFMNKIIDFNCSNIITRQNVHLWGIQTILRHCTAIIFLSLTEPKWTYQTDSLPVNWGMVCQNDWHIFVLVVCLSNLHRLYNEQTINIMTSWGSAVPSSGNAVKTKINFYGVKTICFWGFCC